MTFSFLPADIVSQILNFGLPAPIDVQVVGYNVAGNRQFADKSAGAGCGKFPATVDLHIQQPFDQPYLNIDVDRTKAQQVGFTQRDVATNLLISLSGSFQTTPEFWLDPKTGVSYNDRHANSAISSAVVCRTWKISRSPVPAVAPAADTGQPGIHPSRHRNGGGFAL